MKPVRILPHHAVTLFEVFYLGCKPEGALSWYTDERMEQGGVEAINRVLSNPNQLVQIVNSYDEICRMCPRNRHGDNYAQNPNDTCTTYDNGDVSDRNFAEILGLEDVLGSEPIPARRFFELMEPTYHRLLLEPECDDNGKKLPLRQMFRIKKDETNQIVR